METGSGINPGAVCCTASGNIRDGKLITAAGRTMTGCQSKDGKVDMTLIDREEGKTFVSLALSPK